MLGLCNVADSSYHLSHMQMVLTIWENIIFVFIGLPVKLSVVYCLMRFEPRMVDTPLQTVPSNEHLPRTNAECSQGWGCKLRDNLLFLKPLFTYCFNIESLKYSLFVFPTL